MHRKRKRRLEKGKEKDSSTANKLIKMHAKLAKIQKTRSLKDKKMKKSTSR